MKVIEKNKANFQIKVFNMETGKTRVKSYLIKDADENQIIDKIDKILRK